MKSIGGNVTAQLQKKGSFTKNEIGEKVAQWTTLHTLTGFLDLSAGESNYTTYDAKLQESTHVFICDYASLDGTISAENSRMVINGRVYDVMLLDDPMGLHEQLEIYLKYTGA